MSSSADPMQVDQPRTPNSPLPPTSPGNESLQDMLKQVLEMQEQEKSTAYFAQLAERREKHKKDAEIRGIKRKHVLLREKERKKFIAENNKHVDGECDGFNPDTGKKCGNYRNLKPAPNRKFYCYLHVDQTDEDYELEDEERNLQRRKKRRRLTQSAGNRG